MRKPELTFIKSANNNLIYKIFRLKNSNKDLSLDYYINTDADLVINEQEESGIDIPFSDYPLFIEEDVENPPDFFSVSAPFDIVRNNSSVTINLKNNITSNNNFKIIISFSNNIISKIDIVDGEETSSLTLASDIEKSVMIANTNTILLNKKKFLSTICTADITVKAIRIVDDFAHGLYEPEVSHIETNDYYILYQNSEKFKNKYYYKAIAYNESSISEISDTRVIEVSEPVENIRTIVEYSDNYNNKEEEVVWNELDGEYNPGSEIKISKAKTEIASNVVNNIYQHEIYADDRLVTVDGTRVIKIPNIWHSDRKSIMTRAARAFRVKNILKKDESIYSEYTSPIELSEDIEVLIDKMIILKKNVTHLPKETASIPISLNDIDASTIKIYIRQGGLYYKDYLMDECEVNSPDTLKDITSLMTLDSRFPLLSIKDTCIYSNRYNYTVYLFDETGNISDPVSVVL